MSIPFPEGILIGNFSFTSLVIAKLDVLDTFEEVKIGISYKHKGKVLESFPGNVISLYIFVAVKNNC